MTSALLALARPALEALAVALGSGKLQPPFSSAGVARFLAGSPAKAIAEELEALRSQGVSAAGLSAFLRLLLEDRAAREKAARQIELVWTGPELPGSQSRDTAVVVNELIVSATRKVVITAYALFQGRQLFAPLAARMDDQPELEVWLFLNVPRDPGCLSESEEVNKFAAEFKKKHWPGKRLPEVYYDPRSLDRTKETRAVLHAKSVIVDSRRTLVTSANFTEAAHERNIEAGVLIEDASFATALEFQFSSLVKAGQLKRLPV